MRTGSFRAYALVPSLLMLCMRIQGGSGAEILFGEIDIRASEDKSTMQVIVQVKGENTGDFTAVVTPLTVAQFQAQRDMYGTICDSVMKTFEEIDTAEEEDFSTHPVKRTVLDDDVHSGLHEFTVNITINNDNIQELAEYFLLVLDVQDSDPELLQIDSSKQCSGIKITEDKDDFGVAFEPIVTEMSEDAGEVELFKIVKMGQTEQVVEVTLWSSGADAFTVSEMTITLQPNETSTIVNINVIDDHYPEDNETFTITGYTDQTYGRYQNSLLSVTFTINDDDYAMIGFNVTEVTVIEGEVVRLTTVLKNNLTVIDFHRIEFFFAVKTKGGNATEQHYKSTNNLHYLPGNAIEIQTINDNELERSRQFEVFLEDPSFNPLNILNPSRVIVTIRDNDGIPNQPSLGTMTFYERSITILWTIERDELRPIEAYIITIESIQVRPPSSDRMPRGTTTTRVNRQINQDSRIKTRQVKVTNVNCKSNASGIDYCEHTLEEDVASGTAYNVKFCAGNEFASMCDESGFAIPTIVTLTTIEPAGLEGNTDGNGLSTTTKLWIVIGVLAALLLCCSVLVCLSFCTAVIALLQRGKEIDEEDEKRGSRMRSSSDSSTEVI